MSINRFMQNKLVWQCFFGLWMILWLLPLSETSSAEYLFTGLMIFSMIGEWAVSQRQDLSIDSSTFRKGFFYGLSLVWIGFALGFGLSMMLVGERLKSFLLLFGRSFASLLLGANQSNLLQGHV